jgi:ankyrin repeat protein
LIDAGADVIGNNTDGKTALDMAERSGKWQYANQLRRALQEQPKRTRATSGPVVFPRQ